MMSHLNNISPVDGRYAKVTAPLQDFFSEQALIKYRVDVEVEYLIALANIPLPQLKHLSTHDYEIIRALFGNFTAKDATEVKSIEKTTNHDIKAVEYFVKKRLQDAGYDSLKEFVHLGLTSQDINNTAIPLSFKDAMQNVVTPALNELLKTLHSIAEKHLSVPMLARTHGQAASPTTMGKEVLVFYDRLKNQLKELAGLPYPAKFGGATGNFNAHHVAYPDVDWVDFANRFTDSLGLTRSQITTQIDHYDRLSAIFDCLKRICTIIIDLDRDFWTYISLDYFKQKILPGEVGSSAMPHKVNPIDFENSEGNAGIAIALLEHLAVKLPVSRLQRDLSDSTAIRNIGVAVAHLLIGIKASIRGLNKLNLNKEKIDQDLDANYAVVAEAIQTILRTLDYPNPYESLKSLTRLDKPAGKKEITEFINNLDIPEREKQRLREITPFNYTGIIPKI
jgi:adenylosuccinate lyase